MDNYKAFEASLRQMGINPRNIGQVGQTLPPIPASDPDSLSRNRYDGFYQYRSQEVWGNAEVTSNVVADFKKCAHYFVRHGKEIICRECHIGWIVPDSFRIVDGKMYDGETYLRFAH